jgi:hypothetical protein
MGEIREKPGLYVEILAMHRYAKETRSGEESLRFQLLDNRRRYSNIYGTQKWER